MILYYLSKDELGSWDNVETILFSRFFDRFLPGWAHRFTGQFGTLGLGEQLEIARFFGVSELVIGLTIIAAGTSLPELAASVAAALKSKTNMAFPNRHW